MLFAADAASLRPFAGTSLPEKPVSSVSPSGTLLKATAMLQRSRAADVGSAMMKAAEDLADSRQGPPDPLDPWDNAKGSALQVGYSCCCC